MEDNRNQVENTLSDQAKVISLFQFIQELNKLKQKAILNVKDYPWSFSLSDLPNDPENISLHYQDRVSDDLDSEKAEDGNLILSVHKPEFQKCPEPELSFELWLEPGWNDFRQEASVVASMPGKETDEETGEPIPVLFSDDANREMQYQQWLEKRKVWADRQLLTGRTRELFTDLYRLYFELKRESETEEMIAANGFLRDRNNAEICHPVLTHRVRIDYDPDANTVFVRDTEIPSDLYSVVFQIMEDINLGEVNVLSEDLKKNDYHPLDRNETPGFLKVLVHQLSSDSAYSESGIPANWEHSSRLLLYLNPCFIVRKRLDGTLKAIEQIIENVQQTGEVPGPIRDIVSGGIQELPEDTGEESIDEQLAAVGGESIDILLSKQANKEQLNIARRIEQYKGKETLSTSHKQPAILREPILVPGISGPEMVSKADKQQVIPGMEDVLPEDDDIITLLKKNGVRFVDKRKNNGSLWLIGGSELKPIVNKAKKLGINFRFKEDGGKATKGAPGWWGK